MLLTAAGTRRPSARATWLKRASATVGVTTLSAVSNGRRRDRKGSGRGTESLKKHMTYPEPGSAASRPIFDEAPSIYELRA